MSKPVEKEFTIQDASREDNKIRFEDVAAHDWYRFVLSFPPHLVRDYLERFSVGLDSTVLDPFCGTGTTLVECKKAGVTSIGIEQNPIAAFASTVKVDWSIDPDKLVDHAQRVADRVLTKLRADGINEDDDLPLFRVAKSPLALVVELRTLSSETWKILLKDSISPLPLHKILVLIETLNEENNDQLIAHERLALAKAIVFSFSNLRFGPEVGLGPIRRDAQVVASWLTGVRVIANDIRKLRGGQNTKATVFREDAREVGRLLEPESVAAVITSPPYPNEKDYTRTTRLESVLLGFIESKADLRAIKQGLVRSNTRSVYKADMDDELISEHVEIGRIAGDIEQRRLELGKTSGFERLYARVTKLYFGGMARHLTELRSVLRPGAQLAYVVGDQASYLRIMIRTGQLLADIAQSLGYEVLSIDLFRTRIATATKEQLREEVVVLRWPGKNRKSR